MAAHRAQARGQDAHLQSPAGVALRIQSSRHLHRRGRLSRARGPRGTEGPQPGARGAPTPGEPHTRLGRSPTTQGGRGRPLKGAPRSQALTWARAPRGNSGASRAHRAEGRGVAGRGSEYGRRFPRGGPRGPSCPPCARPHAADAEPDWPAELSGPHPADAPHPRGPGPRGRPPPRRCLTT